MQSRLLQKPLLIFALLNTFSCLFPSTIKCLHLLKFSLKVKWPCCVNDKNIFPVDIELEFQTPLISDLA